MANDDAMKEETEHMGSYMDLRLHFEMGEDMQLIVPTMWDAKYNMWLGFYKFDSGKIINANGKTPFQLTNNFTVELQKYMENGGVDDVLKSFGPVEKNK